MHRQLGPGHSLMMWLSGAERCPRSHGILSCCCCLSCRKIKSVEFMACDALALAAGPLGLREAICKDADLQVITCWHGDAVYAGVVLASRASAWQSY